jgi:hypothetical protein
MCISPRTLALFGSVSLANDWLYLPIDPRSSGEQTRVKDHDSVMSRVHDALRRANAVAPRPAPTVDQMDQFFTNLKQGRTRAEALPVLKDEEEPAESPKDVAPLAPSKHPLLGRMLRRRWVRRLLRVAGIRTTGPVATCSGVTRHGQPCRGLAMANGLCRMHGGSRSGRVAERTRSALKRMIAAR